MARKIFGNPSHCTARDRIGLAALTLAHTGGFWKSRKNDQIKPGSVIGDRNGSEYAAGGSLHDRQAYGQLGAIRGPGFELWPYLRSKAIIGQDKSERGHETTSTHWHWKDRKHNHSKGFAEKQIRFSEEIIVWGYRGFRIRTDEEADTWEQTRIDKDHTPWECSICSTNLLILFLLKNILFFIKNYRSNIMELLELGHTPLWNRLSILW